MSLLSLRGAPAPLPPLPAAVLGSGVGFCSGFAAVGGVLWSLWSLGRSVPCRPVRWSRRVLRWFLPVRCARPGSAGSLAPRFPLVRAGGACGRRRGLSPAPWWWLGSPVSALRLGSRPPGLASSAFQSRSRRVRLAAAGSGRSPSRAVRRRCWLPRRPRRLAAGSSVPLRVRPVSASAASVVPAAAAALPVAVVGSRSLPAGGAALVGRVVSALVRAGRPLCVGCAVGADAAAVSAALASGAASRLSVFAVGGPRGAGFWSGSAFAGVVSAGLAGASVYWWSGGGPSAPLRARLACRSRACVTAAPGGLVAFLSSPSSVGSLGAVSLAASSGFPVCVFCLGFSPSLLPVPVPGGAWVPAAASGLWSAAVHFVHPPSLL